jgi:hypothetical protein
MAMLDGGSITGKHCYCINVVEFAVTFFVESGPYVGNQNLRSLHDANFAFLKGRLVPKAGEMVGEEID